MKDGPDCPYGVLVGLTGQGQHARPETTFGRAAAVRQPNCTFRQKLLAAQALQVPRKCNF